MKENGSPKNNDKLSASGNADAPTKTASSSEQIAREIDRFHRNLDSLATTLPFIVGSLISASENEYEKVADYEEKHAERVEEHEDSRTVTMTPDTITPYRKLWRRHDRLSRAAVLVPETFVVALVSQYDAFLGGLVRALMKGRPEVTNDSAISVPFAQLVTFESIEAARDAIILSEVEQLLRKSHADQLSWIEKKFAVALKTGDVAEWPVFIELTERRNLFVHTRGVVSRQYIDVCRRNGVQVGSDIEIGKALYVNPKYFLQAQRSVLVFGVMLGHVLWRKVLPEQGEAADKHMNNLCYDLLVERHYKVTARLLDFACALRKFASEELRRLMVVNWAQAYKWLGDDQKCAEIMSREDWSASDDSFRLADAVLRDNVAEATRIMKRLGADHDLVSKEKYRDWPLFRKIRPNDEFRTTYKEIFGEPLERIEVKIAEGQGFEPEAAPARSR